MSPELDLSCVISGSLKKFKPEIDKAIDEFTDLGVTVLEPNKGWLYISPNSINTDLYNFRPLPSEKGLSIKTIENRFLKALASSDFLYIINPSGYIGSSVSLELGFALGIEIPIYSQEKITTNSDYDAEQQKMISEIKAYTPTQVICDFSDKAKKS